MATNLLSTNQATVEVDTSGFTRNSGPEGIARTTSTSWQGSASLQVVDPGTVSFAGVHADVPWAQLQPGATYTFSVYVRGAVGGERVCATLQQSDSPYAVYGPQVEVVLTTDWQRLSVTATLPTPLPTTPLGLGLKVIRLSAEVAQTFYLDGLQLELGTSASPWSAPDPLLALSAIQAVGGLSVLHAGQDISTYVLDETISIDLILAQGPGVGVGGAAGATQITFDAYLGPAPTAIGGGQTPSGTDLVRLGDVHIYDGLGNKVFGGVACKFDDHSDSINTITTFTCESYWSSLDRIQVFQLFTGQGDVAMMRSLLTTYAPWVDQSLLPATDNYIWEKFPAKGTLREVLQKFADTVGWGIWIDADAVVHYVSLSSASTAPFALSDEPDYRTTRPHTLLKYEQDDTSVINRVYFYGGKNVSDDFTQDLSVQANGTITTFALLYFPHEATDNKIHLVKNGVELVMYSVFDTDPSHFLKSQGGTADALINRDSEVVIFDTPPLKTDTLTITYRYNTPLVLVLEDQSSYNFFGQWFDGKITDENVYDAPTALQQCRVLLAEQSFGLVSLQVECWQPGLYPGQLLHVTNAPRGVEGTYLIQKVSIRSLGAGFFSYTCDLGAWNWSLLDVLVQAARALNPVSTATEEDLSVIQAKDMREQAVATLTIVRSERLSGQYYSRTAALGDGHDAYSGYFTITS